MSTITQSSRRAERTRRAAIGIGPWTWLVLWVNARIDGRRGIPFIAADAEPQTVSTSTPVIKRICTDADQYATVEGLRFKVDVDAEWTRWDAVTADIARLETAIAAATPASGAPAEEALRRLVRRLDRARRAVPPLAATINARFFIAQLRTIRYFDHGDAEIALYWRTLRRRSGSGLRDEPPTAERPAWLASTDGVTVLEQWNRTTEITEEGN